VEIVDTVKWSPADSATGKRFVPGVGIWDAGADAPIRRQIRHYSIGNGNNDSRSGAFAKHSLKHFDRIRARTRARFSVFAASYLTSPLRRPRARITILPEVEPT
jgi:hypothetical protein